MFLFRCSLWRRLREKELRCFNSVLRRCPSEQQQFAQKQLQNAQNDQDTYCESDTFVFFSCRLHFSPLTCVCNRLESEIMTKLIHHHALWFARNISERPAMVGKNKTRPLPPTPPRQKKPQKKRLCHLVSIFFRGYGHTWFCSVRFLQDWVVV